MRGQMSILILDADWLKISLTVTTLSKYRRIFLLIHTHPVLPSSPLVEIICGNIRIFPNKCLIVIVSLISQDYVEKMLRKSLGNVLPAFAADFSEGTSIDAEFTSTG